MSHYNHYYYKKRTRRSSMEYMLRRVAFGLTVMGIGSAIYWIIRLMAAAA